MMRGWPGAATFTILMVWKASLAAGRAYWWGVGLPPGYLRCFCPAWHGKTHGMNLRVEVAMRQELASMNAELAGLRDASAVFAIPRDYAGARHLSVTWVLAGRDASRGHVSRSGRGRAGGIVIRWVPFGAWRTKNGTNH